MLFAGGAHVARRSTQKRQGLGDRRKVPLVGKREQAHAVIVKGKRLAVGKLHERDAVLQPGKRRAVKIVYLIAPVGKISGLKGVAAKEPQLLLRELRPKEPERAEDDSRIVLPEQARKLMTIELRILGRQIKAAVGGIAVKKNVREMLPVSGAARRNVLHRGGSPFRGVCRGRSGVRFRALSFGPKSRRTSDSSHLSYSNSSRQNRRACKEKGRRRRCFRPTSAVLRRADIHASCTAFRMATKKARRSGITPRRRTRRNRKLHYSYTPIGPESSHAAS